MKKCLTLGSLFIWAFLNGAISGPFAAVEEEAEQPKQVIVQKKVVGTIAYVNSNFISVEYEEKQNSVYEMAFNMDKNIKVQRIKDISELKHGDTVEVAYEETQEEYKVEKSDGSLATGMKIIERKPKILSFLRPAPAALSSGS